MPICRYYQQGTCRYGNSCRFEHVDYYGQSVLRSNRQDYNNGYTREYDRNTSPLSSRQDFNSNHNGYRTTYNQNSNAQNYSRNDSAYSNRHGNRESNAYQSDAKSPNRQELMRALQLTVSDSKGQWPLTCFAPFKERPCIPGWEDYSPEELRYMMYEASRVGAVEECKKQIQALQEAAYQRKQRILNPDAEMYSIIEKVYQGQVTEPSAFSFTQQVSSNNVFGGNSTFGETQQDNSSFNSFKFSLPQSTVSHSTSMFDHSQVPLPQTHGFFGTNAQENPNSASIFGGNLSNNEQTSSNMFANSTTVNFGSNASAFDNNAFSQPQLPPLVSPVNIGFSGVGRAPPSSPQDSYIYSNASDLTDEEKQQFLSHTFTLGKIPTKPPTKDVCF